jgi:diguanylate cyclase (GGDEF)-like protein
MADSETPQHTPEPDGASGSSAEVVPSNGSPQQGSPPQQGDQVPAQTPSAPSVVESQDTNAVELRSTNAVEAQSQSANGGPLAAATSPSSRLDRFGRFGQVAQHRKAVWAAVAVLCVAAGTVGSLLGAQTVAHHNAAEARQTFNQTSAGIASALKVAVQREEDLAVSASTFYAGSPKASPAEFAKWAKWAQMLRHYPELNGLGLVALVRTPELAAFEARITGKAVAKAPAGSAVKPLAPRSAPPVVGGFRIVPAGTRPFYCLALAGLARSSADSSAAGQDYCSPTSARLLSSRDSAVSSDAPISAGRTKALEVTTPVYRGGLPPSTVAGRRATFVGWLREMLVPQVVVAGVLRGHTDNAVRLRYRTGSSAKVTTLTSGTQQTGAQSTTVGLHNGWSARIFGPAAGGGVSGDGEALGLLIGGILLSLLLGLLVFVLGAPRGPARALAPETHELLPGEDLYDALTGLPNRSLTLDRAERMVARAGRQSGMLAGALFIDIDWFKDVNDKLGQAAGDQLLGIVSERLEGVIRTGDTVGRLGGDEFVLLVESAARGVRLDSLARRVIEALHKPVELDGFGPSFYATASIGVAFGRYETPDDLLRDAQLALYSAKAAGKDRYTLFNANMRSVIESRAVLEAELNTALSEQQFFLLYEPIYNLSTRKVVGLEALIRWRHPEQGVLQPVDFISLAEETELIVPIGRWVLEQACNRAAAWNVAGHRVSISIGVSANQLNRDGFATDVRRALQQSGIEPSLLTLEISETTVMDDLQAVSARLAEIRQLGVRIAINDFGGSGYARHSDLQRMPLDFLKVDRTSLAASDDEDYRSWLIKAILIVARDLSLTVIATGIDTYEQMTTVQAMGCTMAQGLFMGEPTPLDRVESLFNADFPITPAPTTPAPTTQVTSTSQFPNEG